MNLNVAVAKQPLHGMRLVRTALACRCVHCWQCTASSLITKRCGSIAVLTARQGTATLTAGKYHGLMWQQLPAVA
jgi:hypothetical protein